MMRNRLVLFFIVWLAAFPVVGKATLCCHMQILAAPAASDVTHCPHHEHAVASDHIQAKADAAQVHTNTCHCDYVQHSQFLASLPLSLSITPVQGFIPPIVTLHPPAERADLRYRPPIA